MTQPTPQPSDGAISAGLDEIAASLRALGAAEEPAGAIGQELASIRVQLQNLAIANAEVGAQLAASLGLEPPAA